MYATFAISGKCFLSWWQRRYTVLGTLNTAKRETVPQVCLHSRPITSLALTADGRHFFTAAGDGAVFMCKIQVRGNKKRAASKPSLRSRLAVVFCD